jgi:hypothetical protein
MTAEIQYSILRLQFEVYFVDLGAYERYDSYKASPIRR